MRLFRLNYNSRSAFLQSDDVIIPVTGAEYISTCLPVNEDTCLRDNAISVMNSPNVPPSIKEYIMSMLDKAPKGTDYSKLSDDELVKLVIPRNYQSPYDLQVIRDYLSDLAVVDSGSDSGSNADSGSDSGLD